jgi:hypothetical protein
MTLRDKLPIEDLENGLYIHRPLAGMDGGVPVTQTVADNGEITYHVPAEAFMKVQKERDDATKALNLIASTNPSDPAVRRILERAGIDWEVARNIAAIARSVRDGTFMRDSQ